ALIELKRYEEAITHFDRALSLKPDSEAWSNKGATLNELKKHEEAITHFDRALSLQPDYAEAWSNKGIALNELKRSVEAIAHYERALSLRSDYAEAWSNKGAALHGLKRFEEAITHFERAISLKPDYAEGWSNKGIALNELKRYEEAIAHFDRALSLKPDYAEALSNKGATLIELKRYEEAITHFDRVLSLKPDYAEGWSNKGIALNELKRYEEAIAHYERALSLKPEIDWAHGELLHAKMKICSWDHYQDEVNQLSSKVHAYQKVTQPFPLLALSDDALLHQKASEIYVQDRHPINTALGPIPKLAKKEKIRIGYFSADFRNHAVSFLAAELFEIHDRSRFEIYAFSLLKASPGDQMNLRLRKGFDKFVDVDNLSDLEIAQLARKLEIDIAIDLSGLTQHCRTEIFSYRAAPIQVNWLGYPGSIGVNFIDYIVADKTIIPKSHQQFYTEKVAHLPDTYMVDDSQRISSYRAFTKVECGLPENVFIFCCLNNGYKYNELVLNAWSKILLAVKNSILWISENNEAFKANVVVEFERRGIDSSRIIFAQRVELMADHLARYALADLFLDTHPYNAHSTAIDALKMGIPVLTLMGQSFASRVAASLLNAIGLPELIANTQEEYEALAIELAQNPQKLADIKQTLVNNRLTKPLFNTPLFTKNLEALYLKMHERYQQDLEPDHISID
ncbi:tetratricopeptide repeat protein, partial [Polynucleobacter sp. AP-Feld-500C-C5]|uniref:O-linked N-acetylglucosamine transferase family protein n=1 Tax=Polynucleobacter sp. AP-Feld-500C-C5 TaxID=2576924 RepID=UPI001C0DAABD